MKKIMVILAVATVMAGAALAQERADAFAGVWSNIKVDDRTGDARGLAVDFRPGPEPHVIVVVCDGPCRAPVDAAARVDGRKIAFRVAAERGVVTRFSGEFRDSGVLVLRREGRPWNAMILKPGEMP
jgi:hypothetical protein